MTERRFSTFRRLETPASRLNAELSRLKIRGDSLIGALEPQAMEPLGDALKIASSLAHLPDPLIIIDTRANRALLINNAAEERFTGMRAKGLSHPALEGWQQAAQELEAGRRFSMPDFTPAGRSFERRLSYNDGILQVLFREKKEAPHIFYPFPVIDYSIALGFVNQRNEAARKAFSNLERHPLLSGIKEAAQHLRNGSMRGLDDTVSFDGKTYRRSAVYIAGSDIVRIFASDVTDCASASKSLLLSLCARVERCNSSGWSKQDLAELDDAVREFLSAIKKEKADLGQLEREMFRLSYLSGRMRDADPPRHELDSFKSVISVFVGGLALG